jgi:type IV pilus assembly protein PilM
MIQLAVNSGRPSVLAASKVRVDPRPNDDAQDSPNVVVSAIRQALAEGGFHGREVVSCLPNDRLRITSVRLVETAADGIEEALRKEVVQRFGLDPDRDTINYLLAGDVHQGDEIRNEMILFGADDESIRSHIALLEEAGLKPVGIDALPCALFRSFERSLQRQEDRERATVFVDVGSRFTTVVFGRGRQITFVKQIPIGGEDFNKEIAAKLDVGINEAEMLRGKLKQERAVCAGPASSPADADQQSVTDPRPEGDDRRQEHLEGLDASTRQVMVDAISAVAEKLAEEIALCFRYYTVTFRGKRVERAVISGGEAYETILLNVLKRQLGVELEIAQPLKGLDMMNLDFDSDRRGLLCEWAVAVGLSLKGWDGRARHNQEFLSAAVTPLKT